MAAKVADLPDAWRDNLLTWARLLRDGGPRSRPRDEQTVRAYLGVAADAATNWPQRGHLREVTRDDVLAYLCTLQGTRRESAATALRALFRWAKSHKLIFRNPTHAISIPKVPDPIWQPLRPDEITAATTPQARLCVILAAVHAARPGQIRALNLDDVDPAKRRITIAGNSRPLDELTTHARLAGLPTRAVARHGQPAPPGQHHERAGSRAGQRHLDPEPTWPTRHPRTTAHRPPTRGSHHGRRGPAAPGCRLRLQRRHRDPLGCQRTAATQQHPRRHPEVACEPRLLKYAAARIVADGRA